ncbi:MAG: RagB/SusD family nutrient uptake outer membrane protein [Balneolales bacterium]
MKNLILLTTVLLFLSGVLYSCADLTDSVTDTALGNEVFDNPGAGEQSLAPSYAMMQSMLGAHNWLNNLQGVSSIEQIVPNRGGTDWFDSGRFFEMHQHTWSPQHVTIIDVWGSTAQGIGRAAIAEKTLEDVGASDALKAEARGLKAVYNWWLLDLWDIAFEKSPEDVGTTNLSTVFTGEEAADYLLSELDEIENQLPTVSQVGETRFTQSAAKALKARILINKAVYADRYGDNRTHDTSDMQSVIDYTTELIDDGQFQLENENYFYLFGKENDGNPEVIFSFDQDSRTGGIRNMAYFHASRDRHGSLIHNKTGSDGGALTQEFYDLWEGWRDDPRFFHRYLPDGGTVTDEEFRWNRGVQIGQQYGIIRVPGSAIEYERDENGDLLILPLVDHSRSGDDMIYTREVGLESDNGHVAGTRSLKWDMDRTSPGGSSEINISLFRLGEMYLMRAEANARLGNWDEALSDLNELRDARGARPLLSEELDTFEELEREYIFEMYQEHLTRTVQIRYNSWEDSWRDKTSTDVNKRVFPIPQRAIDAGNGFLTQNRGY